ncbi:MAG: TauD/TfdA family dioxygenase [Chitinophagales bacterium]|nr:TauD/TfdA family dioxygenase [Chitinophagales bacterium]
MKREFPLTKFGDGILISDVKDLNKFSIAEIEELLERHLFIVFKGLENSIYEVIDFVSGFGALVDNEKRTKEHMLIMDGKEEATSIIKGVGRMPLHTDGLLMNEDVRLVAIYGAFFDLQEGGNTYITNNEEAWRRTPVEIKRLIRDNGIELMPCDKDYYLKNEEKWYWFNGVKILENTKEYLCAGMNYDAWEQASYRVRIAKTDQLVSDQYYKVMEEIYESEDLTYHHTWESGDLLLFDNIKTMHGRAAFKGKRKILQLQVRRNANG